MKTYSFNQALDIVAQLVQRLHQAHLGNGEDFDITPTSVRIELDGAGRPVVRVRVTDGSMDGEMPELLSQWRYRAPERWWGGRKNSWTDQYALAALFVELVLGKAPFASVFETNDETVIKTVLMNRPPDLPMDCPRREVLVRALAKEPQARFPSCSSFAAALADPSVFAMSSSDGSGRHHHHHSHHSGGQSPKNASKPISKGKLFLLLALVGGGVYWGWKTGWLERAYEQVNSGAREQERAQKRAKALQEQAEKAATEARIRESNLVAVRAEIEHQKGVSEQALKTLQDFLTTGGPAVIAVRRDGLEQTRVKAQEGLRACERDLEASQTLERALVYLQTSGLAAGGCPSVIPQGSEVAASFRALVEETALLNDLRTKYTENHPQLAAEIKLNAAAQARFKTALDGALAQMRATIAAKEKQLNTWRAQFTAATKDCEELEQAVALAQAKQTELERARERESDRLAELRRKEVDIMFGARETVPTNAPSALPERTIR